MTIPREVVALAEFAHQLFPSGGLITTRQAARALKCARLDHELVWPVRWYLEVEAQIEGMLTMSELGELADRLFPSGNPWITRDQAFRALRHADLDCGLATALSCDLKAKANVMARAQLADLAHKLFPDGASVSRREAFDALQCAGIDRRTAKLVAASVAKAASKARE